MLETLLYKYGLLVVPRVCFKAFIETISVPFSFVGLCQFWCQMLLKFEFNMMPTMTNLGMMVRKACFCGFGSEEGTL